MSSEIAGVLSRAADLIEPAGAWTQGASAIRKDGVIVNAQSDLAVGFCAHGAVLRAAGPVAPAPFLEVVYRVLDASSVTAWNDAPGRTQAEAVQLLRDAAKLAEQEATDAR